MSGKYPPSNRNRYNNRYKTAEDGDKGNSQPFNNRDNTRDNNPRYDNKKTNRVISRNREFEGDGLNISNTVFDNNNADGATVPSNTGDIVDRSSSDNVDNNDIEYTPKEFDKWEDLEGIINEDIMRGIYAYGFDTPSIIQQKALLTMFDKKDIIAQAQSGTGKTGVFTIGALQNINPK